MKKRSQAEREEKEAQAIKVIQPKVKEPIFNFLCNHNKVWKAKEVYKKVVK